MLGISQSRNNILPEKITHQGNKPICKANSFYYAMLHIDGPIENPVKGKKAEFIAWFLGSTAGNVSGDTCLRSNTDVKDSLTKPGFGKYVPSGHDIHADIPAVNYHGEILSLERAEQRAGWYVNKLFEKPDSTALIFDNDTEYGAHSYLLFSKNGDLHMVDTLKHHLNGMFADTPIKLKYDDAVYYIISNKYVVPYGGTFESRVGERRLAPSSHMALYLENKQLTNQYNPEQNPEILVEPDKLLILEKRVENSQHFSFEYKPLGRRLE